MKIAVKGALAALGITAAALATAGIASADDQGYIAVLARNGYGNYSAQEALNLGHAVCAAEAQGESHHAAVVEVYNLTTSGIGMGQAEFITQAAELNLC